MKRGNCHAILVKIQNTKIKIYDVVLLPMAIEVL